METNCKEADETRSTDFVCLSGTLCRIRRLLPIKSQNGRWVSIVIRFFDIFRDQLARFRFLLLLADQDREYEMSRRTSDEHVTRSDRANQMEIWRIRWTCDRESWKTSIESAGGSVWKRERKRNAFMIRESGDSAKWMAKNNLRRRSHHHECLSLMTTRTTKKEEGSHKPDCDDGDGPNNKSELDEMRSPYVN